MRGRAAYADAVLQSGIEFDLIFGPAYKGIPIAVATSLALLKGVSMWEWPQGG